MTQNKRRKKRTGQRTKIRRPRSGRRLQQRSSQNPSPGGVTTRPTASLIPSWKRMRAQAAAGWPQKHTSQLAYSGFTPGRRVGPLSPPLTAATSRSETALRRDAFPNPAHSARTQDDDAASEGGSMTTWIGDRDGEALSNAQHRKGVVFDYDWADAQADNPPIPWDQVQAYTDFHDNKEAHEYWKWDPKELKWRHEDAETGEVVYCPSELD